MPLKKVTFTGNPHDRSDGRASVTTFGESFIVGRPRIVNLSAEAIRKLEGNSHFEIEDAPDQGLVAHAEAVAESHALKNNSPEPPRAEPAAATQAPDLSAGAPEANPSAQAAGAPIETRRERPRGKASGS